MGSITWSAASWGHSFGRFEGEAMRGLTAVLTVSMFVSAPAYAATSLWRNVEVGMSYSDVQALYPSVKGKVHHNASTIVIEGLAEVGKCHPDVVVHFSGGIVKSVSLEARLRGFPATSCGDEAQRALIGKYGAPALTEQGREYFSARPGDYTWVKDGVTVRFDRPDPSGQDLWTISYEPVGNADI